VDVDSASFTAAQAEAIIADQEFHRIAERGKADDLNLLPGEESHFQDSLNYCVSAVDCFYHSALARAQLVKRGHDKDLDAGRYAQETAGRGRTNT
jgi:hypothetical protein